MQYTSIQRYSRKKKPNVSKLTLGNPAQNIKSIYSYASNETLLW